MAVPVTATYLRANSVDIKFDIYAPTTAKGALPVVVFFHGGGLVTGARNDFLYPPWKDDIVKRDIIFISADYRLLFPCTSFDEIADVKALFSFISTADTIGPYLPPHVTIDSSRIAVSGVSAGGYLARLAAVYAVPKPKALWSLFGMGGDFFLDHWVQRHERGIPFMGGKTERSDVALHIDGSAPVTASMPIEMFDGKVNDSVKRLLLFNWLYQEGTYVDEVSGLAGLSEQLRALPYEARAAAVPKEVSAVFPQLVIEADFPPALLTHGAEDSVVLLAESEETLRRLKALGVEVKLTVVAGAEHGLVAAGVLPGLPTPAPGAPAAIQEGLDFLTKHLA